MNERTFEAGRYLMKLKGKDYLEVKWRLLWLRSEHPDARIETELVRLEGGLAVFKARVSLPAGGEATGWGSETTQDFGDYIEKAETKALGRALAALGFGTQFCEDFDFHTSENNHVVDAPVAKPVGLPGLPEANGNVTQATPAQVKAIYVIGRNEHQLSEDELDQRCRQLYGVNPAQLTKRQASEYIDRLKTAPSRN